MSWCVVVVDADRGGEEGAGIRGGRMCEKRRRGEIGGMDGPSGDDDDDDELTRDAVLH